MLLPLPAREEDNDGRGLAAEVKEGEASMVVVAIGVGRSEWYKLRTRKYEAVLVWSSSRSALRGQRTEAQEWPVEESSRAPSLRRYQDHEVRPFANAMTYPGRVFSLARKEGAKGLFSLVLKWQAYHISPDREK